MGKRKTSAPKARQKAPDRILQLMVTLEGSGPSIWRRVQVPADFSLEKLHCVLQLAMGWDDCHLHQFTIGGVRYVGLAPDGSELDVDPDDGDERAVTLADLICRKGQWFLYEYDFGDSWEHRILIEEILDAEAGVRYPICLSGERACPPEDCGGVWGYEHLLKVLADPKDPDHEDMIEWAGDLDPAAFDPAEATKLLQSLI